ncbi:hypothetical protein ACFWUW_32090 [Streptomyces sp. NPDC058655]|uniref:hypothetical protein n=1 Tax=Streptomyces sp. NPDC058655 TaxID=3346577 RepID=UPI00365D69FB
MRRGKKQERPAVGVATRVPAAPAPTGPDRAVGGAGCGRPHRDDADAEDAEDAQDAQAAQDADDAQARVPGPAVRAAGRHGRTHASAREPGSAGTRAGHIRAGAAR